MDRIEQDNPADLRRKLGKRLALAAVLILVLLGGLAVFDYVSEVEREQATKPVAAVQPRVGGSISSPRPGEPSDLPITPPASLEPKEQPAAPEAPPEPEIAAQPGVAAPSVPATATAPAAVPAATQTVAAAPAAKSPVAAAPKAPAPSVGTAKASAPAPAAAPAPLAAVPQPAPGVAAVPEGTSGAPMVGAPPSARLPQPAAATTASSQSVLARLAAGFVLQAGVFTSTERAEELRAKLVMAGVPVVVESRVQVGPFASQKEAAAARQKIRELGVDSIIIPPRGRR